MNNTRLTEKEIRDLLTRWYDAETTACEEQQIIDWFASVDAAMLPADLREERLIFLPLRAPETDTSEAEIALDTVLGRSARKAFLRRAVMGAASVAAVVAVVLSVGLRTPTDNTPTSLPLIALTPPQAEEQPPTERQPDVEASKPKPAQSASAASAKKTRKQARPARPVDANGYEILTPQEASEVIGQSLAMTRAALRTGKADVKVAELLTCDAMEELRIACCNTRRDLKDAKKCTNNIINELSI